MFLFFLAMDFSEKAISVFVHDWRVIVTWSLSAMLSEHHRLIALFQLANSYLFLNGPSRSKVMDDWGWGASAECLKSGYLPWIRASGSAGSQIVIDCHQPDHVLVWVWGCLPCCFLRTTPIQGKVFHPWSVSNCEPSVGSIPTSPSCVKYGRVVA